MSSIIAAVVSPALTFTNSSDESTTKTPIQITAPANQSVKILRWGVFFNEETGNLTPASPFLAEAGLEATASGSGGSGASLKPIRSTTATVQTTALTGLTGAATITDKLDAAYVNTQTGYEVIYPMGQEIVLDPAEVFNINVSSGATLSTNSLQVVAKVWIEE